MIQAALRPILSTVGVTVLVTVLSSLSWAAAPLCAAVYADRSVYTTSYAPLKTLVYESYALTEALKTWRESGAVGEAKTDLQATLQALEGYTEQYLKASGLVFRKLQTKYRMQAKNGALIRLKYGRYLLRGTANGDELSRLIYDLQRKEINHPEPSQFVLDLFYELKYPDSGAHYVPTKHLVEIGPRSIERFVTGLATEIQHEIIHHLEERKVEAGEMSLARFEFQSGKEIKGDPYSVEFALDELITNLQDLKNISDSSRNRKIDDQLIFQMTKEKLQTVQELRQTLRQNKKQLMDVLFQREEAQFGLLKAAVEENRYTTTESGAIEIALKESGYQQVTIHLNGLGSAQSEIKKHALKVIAWAEQEIELLRQEFSSIIKE